ncbi:Na/Pi cotransporter family protein [Pseudoduganella sp. FT93W]|uniref:Na/Pi cotransporter family protein n=1 Tax=Duganella fentianensis TaxID=2692177 RepID=A0A845HWL4_9BURK|nr:Na/Pi symporter [Duganella fentianensis]MYN43965.1 Na/Pi cotransporter family protein [Duganella fentianensis]
MDIFASIFAGLGLFFIGIRLLSNNVKQLIGRRMRVLITRVLEGNGSVALLGLLAGAIIQSLNAVTFVMVALVSAGAIDKRRAFPVINWANLGTSVLILMATLNMHWLILLLIGITGTTYYLNLDQSARYRHAIGALLGLGLLFLGIDFIKSGSAILKHTLWLKDAMQVAGQYPLLSFAIGTLIAALVQSSPTVTVVAMAMAAAGLLPFSSGAMIVLGAGLGSGLATLSMTGKLTGSARQLVLYQVTLKASGVTVMMTLLTADWLSGQRLVEHVMQQLGLGPSGQLAAIYLLLQIASDLAMRALRAPVLQWLEQLAPPSVEETLGRPHYINDEALVEPETALLLVEKEQQRLLASLPTYLDALREDVYSSSPAAHILRAAEGNVIRECDVFLTELADRNHSREVLEQTIVLRDRNQLLNNLQEALAELDQAIGDPVRMGEVRGLIDSLVESLHMMLETLAEVAAAPAAADLEMLRMLTHDRSELMDAIRRRMQGGGIAAEIQQAVFSATGLFERSVWLLRRYVLLLDVRPDSAAPAPAGSERASRYSAA